MSLLSFVQRPMLWIEAAYRFGATYMQAPNVALKLTARKFDPKKYRVPKCAHDMYIMIMIHDSVLVQKE